MAAPGRDFATAVADAPSFSVPRPGAVVELYDSGGVFLRTTVTDATGNYGFAGLVNGNYTVRVVNETVTSSRPDATGTEWPVQTFRTDGTGAAVISVTNEVGGADPTVQDGPARAVGENLGDITAQSVASVTISAAEAKAAVDFGFNFDTIVNTNDSGQGSLREFIDNSNVLSNTNLDQDGLAAGVEHTIFMIPSDTDPHGRPQDPNYDVGRGAAEIRLDSVLPAITAADTAIDGETQTTHVGSSNAADFTHPVYGAAKAVGTGPDGIVGTGDELALPAYPNPEIVIDGDDLRYDFHAVGRQRSGKGHRSLQYAVVLGDRRFRQRRRHRGQLRGPARGRQQTTSSQERWSRHRDHGRQQHGAR